MGVKDLLERNAAGFISLNEVLTLMSHSDGSSYQEAATVLYRLLDEDDVTFLTWKVNNNLKGVRNGSSQDYKNAFTTLRQAALYPLNHGVWINDGDIPF